MEFSQKLILANNIVVENTNVHLKDSEGVDEMIMHIGDVVITAVWADHGKLLVTLENGTIRVYRNHLDYDMI